MPAPKQIGASNQILVEGRDAERFFSVFLRAAGLRDIQVQDYGGVDDLSAFLKAFRNAPSFPQVNSIGVIRDAEDNPAGALRSVQGALRNAGFRAPAGAALFEGDNPVVDILILPSTAAPGMVESLCLDAVANNPVMACVDEYLDCLRQRAGSVPANVPKARLHAFLASCQRPGLRVGEAAEAGYIPCGSPAFGTIRDFLQML